MNCDLGILARPDRLSIQKREKQSEKEKERKGERERESIVERGVRVREADNA